MRIIRLGPLTLDLVRRTASTGGNSTTLTATEAALLSQLARFSPEPVSKSELLKSVWGYHASVRSRTVDTTVGRLRAKIEPIPSTPRFLLTVHGRGLQLVGLEIEAVEKEKTSEDFLGAEDRLSRVRQATEQGGLVAVVGPPGVGKSTVTQKALPEAVVVDVEGMEDRGALQGAVSRTLGVQQMLEAAEVVGLLEGRPLVLDGAEQLSEAAMAWGLELSKGVPVVVVSQKLPTIRTASVVRLAPLNDDEAAALLDAQLGRLGLEVSEATRDAAVAQLDGLPLEIEVLAPTLGLLGMEALALRSRDDPVTVAIRRSLAALVPADRELVHQLSAFNESFSLGAAVAVSGRARAELVGPLSHLQQWSLLSASEGRFQLLRAVRRVGASPEAAQHQRAYADGQRRWCAWMLSLADQALIDGAATLRNHQRDLLVLIRSVVDPEQAEVASSIWTDLASLVGPEEDLAVELGRLARRFPERELISLRWLLLRTSTVGLTGEERTRLEEDPSLDALWVLVRDAQISGDRDRWISLHARALELLVSAPLAVQARMLPVIRQPSADPASYRKATQGLRGEAQTRGWHAIEANLARSELSLLVVSGRYAEALARASEWPQSNDVMGSEAVYWLGVSEMMLGRPKVALSWFEQQFVRHPADRAQALAHSGVALLGMGEEEEGLTRLGKALRPGLPYALGQLCLALLSQHGVQGFPEPDDPEIVKLMATTDPSEEPPARISCRLLWQLERSSSLH